jgi:hypothetical protein
MDNQERIAEADATTHLREIRRAKVYAAYLEAANDPVFIAEVREFGPYPGHGDGGADPMTQ